MTSGLLTEMVRVSVDWDGILSEIDLRETAVMCLPPMSILSEYAMSIIYGNSLCSKDYTV